MELPPPNIIPTHVQEIPTIMPSGSRFLERFDGDGSSLIEDAMTRGNSAASSVRRSLPSIPIDKLPFSSTASLLKPHKSFMSKHGPMIANVVLTAIVFSLFVSQAKSSQKMLPISAALLLTFSAVTMYQRYYYSPCLVGQPWVGYMTIGSLFTSMILLGIWIAK